MRRISLVVLVSILAACGGDTKPLPPLNVGPEWLTLMLDTTGNLLLRRMGDWVDTMHVSSTPDGHALVSRRMQMDMKIGGISTSMHVRTEIDCAQHRFRSLALDSLSTSMNGVALPDSVAKKAMADQRSKLSDTTWKSVDAGDGAHGTMLSVACAKLAAAAAAAPAKPPAGK